MVPRMNRATLEWFDLLARSLVWAAGIVLLLAVIGAVVIAGSDNAIPLIEEAERQGRGVLALASLGGGLTSAGLLGGIGAILRLLVATRLEELGPEAGTERDDQDAASSPPAKPARERSGRRSGRKPASREERSATAEERDGE